jgi:hypothetical protein
MNFQQIVVMVAAIILIGLLTWIGYGMYESEHNAKFPPISSDCPDYWVTNKNGCVNIKHLGSCNNGQNNTMDFNKPPFVGKNGICAKSDWARRCGVTWNGVTNAGAKLQKVCGFQ